MKDKTDYEQLTKVTQQNLDEGAGMLSIRDCIARRERSSCNIYLRALNGEYQIHYSLNLE